MLPIKKILVGVDGSDMDDTLISFVSFILSSSPVQEIYFVNIVSSTDQITGVDNGAMASDMVSHQEEILRKKLEKVGEDVSRVKVELVVKKGHVLKEVLKFISTADIDIVISGNKKASRGSGVLNMRLARRAPCSLIVIPEGHMPRLKRLLLPIDFSIHSKLALEYAVYISRSNDNQVELICQNVYEVPTGYHYSGKSYREFSEIMKENARKEYEQWVSKIDTEGVPVSAEFTLDDKDEFGKVIKETAMAKDVSGVIIGAHGRTAASALFIGSTAEKLVQEIDYLPLTIVRKKGSNATVLESLREL